MTSHAWNIGLVIAGITALIGLGLIISGLRQRAKAATPAPVPAAPLPRPAVGLVVHESTAADLNRLFAISASPRIRTTDYGDDASYQRLLAFAANHIPMLVIQMLSGAMPRVQSGTTTDIQIGNEPDVQAIAITPESYGASVRRSLPVLRQQLLEAGSKIVTAGFSNGASVDWMTRALLAGAMDADAICFHVYGDDLVQALTARLFAVGQAMAAAGCTKPLWITEVGFTSADPMKQLTQLTAFLAYSMPPAIERVYVYALATDELTDFYGICAHDTARTPRPAYAAVRVAMVAHP